MKTTTKRNHVTDQPNEVIGNTVEAFTRLSEVTFSGMERLTALNLNVARESLQEVLSVSQSLTRAQDLKELGNVQSPHARAGAELVTAYVHGVQEILSETQSEFAELLEKLMSSFSMNNPMSFPGMEVFAKVAQQTSDMTLGYVRNVAEATEKVVVTTSQQRRRSA